MSNKVSEEFQSHFDELEPARRKRETGLVSLNQVAWRLDLSPFQVKRLAERIGLAQAIVKITKCRTRFEERAAEAACRRFLELKAMLVKEGKVRLGGRGWGAIVANRLAREREGMA